jgi:flagellar biosynthesis component FlhA
LKDILDPFELTGILYALVFVATLIASTIIFFMMVLTGIFEGKSNRIERKIIRSYLILTLATVVEIIPGVNLIPIESFSVLIIYTLALQERKQNKIAQEETKKLEEKTQLEQQREEQEERQREAQLDALRQQDLAQQEMASLAAADDYYQNAAPKQQEFPVHATADDYPRTKTKAA